MRVAVTGGTGYLGRFIVAALLEAGHEVRLLVREPARAGSHLPPAVEIVGVDAMDRTAAGAAMRGCDALVQSAAVYSYQRTDAQRMVEENPRLAASLLGAAGDAGLTRVVDISSAVVFRLGLERVDEAASLAGPGDRGWDDPYLQSKVRAEQVGRELEAAGLPRVTLHPTMVVGPQDSGPGTSGGVLISLLRGGQQPRGRLGWVDVRDVAAAAVAALTAAPGTRYVLSIGSRPLSAIAARLDALTGRSPRRLFLPPAAVRLAARLNDLAGGRLAPVPSAPAVEYVLEAPSVIDGSLATRELGIDYRDLDETLADAVRWWAANGIIPPELAGRLVAAPH